MQALLRTLSAADSDLLLLRDALEDADEILARYRSVFALQVSESV